MAKGKCHIPESVRNKVVVLIRQGEKQEYVASLYGISVGTVSRLARINGLSRPANVAKVFTEEEYWEMAKLNLSGVSNRVIARKYRCSATLIRRTLKKLGIRNHQRIFSEPGTR